MITYWSIYITVALTIFAYCNIRWFVSKEYRDKNKGLEEIGIKTNAQRVAVVAMVAIMWPVTLTVATVAKLKGWDKDSI